MKPLFLHRCPLLPSRRAAFGSCTLRAVRTTLFFAAALLTGAAQAQIFSNGITDGNPSGANPFTTGQTVAANLTVSGIGRGPGINANAGQDRYNATAWTTAAASDANDYFTWTLTPAAGYKLDLTSLTGNCQRSNTGPATFALRSSLDNYATDLGTVNPGTGATAFNFSLAASAFDNITAAITFRLYGWSAGSASGTASVNDFVFNGAVVQLPVITASTTSLAAFNTQLGTPSAVQTFTVSGTALTTPLVVTAPAGFELRENNVGSYGSSVSFPNPTVGAKTIQVRMTGASTGSFSGNVTCVSTGATTRNIAVSGTVISVNTRIQFSASSATLAQNAGSIDLTLQITNPDASAATDIQVVLTSGDPATIGGFATQDITFPAGSGTDITVPVTITDNGIWDAGSTVVFTLQGISGGQGTPSAGPNTTFTLTLQEYLPLTLLLNEIDYSMPGEGAEFIELKNTGNAGLDLHDFKIDLVYEDGGPQLYDQITLPSFVLQPGMYYVVCGDPANVPDCDLTATLPTDFIAGGLTAAIGLRSPASTLVDAVSYEGNVGGGYTEGSSTLTDPADIDGVSIARIPDGQDTQQNGNDLRASCPTPGTANKAEGTACDDGDPNTLVDVVLADCSCAGTPAPAVDCEGVEGGPALPGTACDDEDAETLNDTWTVECSCVGTPVVRDCLGAIDGPAMPGTACDDLNVYTENDTWDNACVCSGTLVPTPPAVTTDNAASITATTAVLNATITEGGSSAVIAHGFEYSTTNGFVLGTGTPVEAGTITDGAFSGTLDGLQPGTTYYYIAFATNAEGSGNGAQLSFSTLALATPVATPATNVGADAFTATWETVEGATGYRLDVSTSPTFGTTTLATDLFISEYVEGSSNNKYIELYNGTGAAVDLSGYRLRLYSNGGTSVTNDAALSGSLPNGSTIVYRNSGAVVYAGAATVNGAVNYNGDDAVALFRSSTGANVDIFGRIGEDPGSAWTAGGLSTVDRTLVRKPTVSGGVTTNPGSGFPTLGTEWNGAATDAVGDLGQHTFISFVPDMLPGYADLAVTGLSQEVTGLTPGTTYYYRVRAVNGATTTENSNTIAVTTGVLDCENVLNGSSLPGTACDDGDAATGNDVYNAECVCQGQLIDCLGVPGGTATIGSACDDGDATTGNDIYNAECVCQGQLIDCLGIPGGTATISSACDDGDAATGNDIYNAECVCQGQIIDCLGVPGGTATIGSTCDDGDATTGNDVYNTECVCEGQLIDCLGVPGGTATIGSACDDGDATTGNDVYNTECVCEGQLIDCLGVPGGTTTIGSTCDDGDASTENDVYGSDCQCAGTPTGPCSGNQLVVTVRTDANGGQTTWQVYDAFAFTVASGGPYPAQNNTTITETVCLPTTFGSCYSFYLFDSFGDGLCCANGEGYWELRSPSGALLLRDRFAATPDGHQSPAVAPLAPGYILGHQFCLPAGPASILPDECGIFTNTLQSKVYCTSVPGGAQYQFEFSDPDAGFRRFITLPRNWVKFSEMQTSPLIPGTVYFARVRVDQNAAGFSDDHFGAGCEMAITTNLGCTSLIDEPNTPTHSCGTTRHFNTSEKVWAYPVVGATQYRFRFSNPGEGFTRYIERPSYVCPLGWFTAPLQAGVTYDVQVDVLVNTVWSGFCGPVCQVTILAPGQTARPETRSIEASTAADVRLWPNPVSDGRVNVRAEGLTESHQHVRIALFDAFGKQVMVQELENEGDVLNTILTVPSTVAKGVYLVDITINGRSSVQRLSVQ